MAEGLSFTAKGFIAVVLVLMLASVYGKAPGIAYAATKTVDRNLEAVGINIIDIPKILSLTPSVNPNGSVAVAWRLNRDGNEKLKDSNFKAVFFYKKYPDDLIDDVCTVEKINHYTPKLGWTCSINGGRAVLQKEGCAGSDCLDKLAGLYKVDVSFEEKDEKSGRIIHKDEMETDPPFGFYTKTYLDNFDQEVKDCPDCNVKECKRNVLIDSLVSDCNSYVVKVVYNRAFNELYKSPNIMASCQYPPLNRPTTENDITSFKNMNPFKLCPVEEFNKLYQKAASWVFFDSACEKVSMADETVTEAEKLFELFGNVQGVRGIDLANKSTQDELSECARKADVAFTVMGWKFLLTKHDREEYKIPERSTVAFYEDMARSNVKKGVDKYLQNELPPVIINLKATFSPDGNPDVNLDLIKVSWDLPVGSNNVKSMELSYVYRSFPSSDNKFTSPPASPPVVVSLDKAKRTYLFTPKTPKELTGQHKFTITAKSANPAARWENSLSSSSYFEGTDQKDEKKTDIGIYSDNYVELYRDLIGVADACGGGCDVAGKKEAALGDNQFGWSNLPGKTGIVSTYVYVARCGDTIPRYSMGSEVTNCGDNGGKFQGSCQLDTSQKEGEKRITGCSEKEVDTLYMAVVTAYARDKGLPTGKKVGDLLKIDCWGEMDSLLKDKIYKESYKDTKIKDVCKAKDLLRKELEKAGWVYWNE